ncbi:outer membrane beta-barrel protein [Chryseobacterium sp. Leaf201]|uniref:outer membrane beta-barrel protein n=1 Tax=Chryseobacterium sp. Leaf201 TaxID=1735672 RepID=UPI0006F72493|nr:outer membrane beta-barrel protein [Chryseobacterium sp. Leaf201]KQM53711.1 opacity protein [Chryseobacterium sp. Leaf201]
MKKVLLAGAVALFGLSNAQIAKGTVYLSGQVNYSSVDSRENNDAKTEDLRIIPTAGFFVGNNVAVGLGVGYKQSTEKATVTQFSGPYTFRTVGKYTEDAVVVAPFVRKYWTIADKLYVFGQLEVPMEFGNYKTEAAGTLTDNVNNSVETQSISTKTKYTSVGVNIKPGLDYFLNKNWSIEATFGEFGFNTYKLDAEGAENRNDYRFGLNLSSVTFGVKYVFAK